MADIAPIAVAKKYAGIGVSLVARIKNTKTPFSIDFDGATLTEALRKTFENRGHTFTAEQFEQVMAFDSDDAMQKKWKAFVRKIPQNYLLKE
ncbi:nucleotidyl transferase AbiEii/AbiGii toxin family protein [Lachnospiraceae bacterium 47-T17]